MYVSAKMLLFLFGVSHSLFHFLLRGFFFDVTGVGRVLHPLCIYFLLALSRLQKSTCSNFFFRWFSSLNFVFVVANIKIVIVVVVIFDKI